jgi:hypothetical protein
MPRIGRQLYLALLFLAIGAGVSVPVLDHLLYSQKQFDGGQWRNGNARQRARMVPNLVSGRALLGRSRDEVVELLGPPDRAYLQIMEYDYVHGELIWDWFDLPFSNWRKWVCIEFDGNESRVRNVETRD